MASGGSERCRSREHVRRRGSGLRGDALGERRRTRGNAGRNAITAARNHGDNQLNGNS